MSAANGARRRERLDGDRVGRTIKLVIQSAEGPIDLYVTANTYPDGRLGEVFVKGAGKEGSTLAGLMDDLWTTVSIALQSGADLSTLCRKLHRSRYEPRGPVDHPALGRADSLPDAVAMLLAWMHGDEALRREMGVLA